jgi:L-2-hydroxyglutarate oxidase
MKNVIIVGGGIVGLATAYKLSCKYNDIQIIVLEKENEVGLHQTTHNSGVLHCGLYYKPGSLKAKLAVDGIKQMTSFCKQYNIPHEICGKLVVATNEIEHSRLKDLYKRGIENGLEGLKYLDNKEEIQKIEPYVTNAIAAIHVPQEGIVDYKAVINKLKLLILKKGHLILCNSKVNYICNKTNTVSVKSPLQEETYAYDYLINCTGLYSDVISKLTTTVSSKIVPFRGEYYKLKKESEHLVNNLIYPVPDPSFPFLGVHFTRLIHGGIEAGPNAVLAFSREGYKLYNINLLEMLDYLCFRGFWKFIWKHKSMCWKEFWQSLSKKRLCKSLQKLIPSITENDLMPGGSGVRAQAMSIDGNLIQDFEIHIVNNNICNVLNAPSPAATASLSIADIILNKINL